jgi:hypothetical protein
MIGTVLAILGPLCKWVFLALFELREKNREAIEVADDPALYRGLSGYQRL